MSPSSHVSAPLVIPSPQYVQSVRQRLPPGGGGSEPGGSHVSPGLMTVLPHSGGEGDVQSLRQKSLLFGLPSSHCSPLFTTPSPQYVQLIRQRLPPGGGGSEPGGSHVS